MTACRRRVAVLMVQSPHAPAPSPGLEPGRHTPPEAGSVEAPPLSNPCLAFQASTLTEHATTKAFERRHAPRDAHVNPTTCVSIQDSTRFLAVGSGLR